MQLIKGAIYTVNGKQGYRFDFQCNAGRDQQYWFSNGYFLLAVLAREMEVSQ
jgi:hypothetical protein